jgi:hypothetical protein
MLASAPGALEPAILAGLEALDSVDADRAEGVHLSRPGKQSGQARPIAGIASAPALGSRW